MKKSLLIVTFPYGGSQRHELTSWLVRNVALAKADPRIGEVVELVLDDTPITMTRNFAAEQALKNGMDLVLFVDSDMFPDYGLHKSHLLPNQKPFLPSALNFMLGRDGPSIVAAPYCGKPPCENVFVFRWLNNESDNPNCDMTLEQVSRDSAERMAGFEEVAALPTGLMLIDARCFRKLEPPYFYYEYTDKTESVKASTEDVTFTRDVSLSGTPVYCLWDSWAGHWKYKCVGKPHLLPVDAVRKQFADALRRNRPSDEITVMVGASTAKTSAPWDRSKMEYLNTQALTPGVLANGV